MDSDTDTLISKKAVPFLRWTGSKSWFVKNDLQKYLPQDFQNYHELFLGGGSVFFHLAPTNQSYLYDLNEELINTYIQIRDNLEMVIKSLKELKNSKEDYYTIRSRNCRTNHTRAARFIYLNRTSFNGIYRVNSNGEYNVPYGWRQNVDIVTEENLKCVKNALSGVHLINSDFENSIQNIGENDLVYIDPPYTVAHQNNGFIAYNSKLFSWEDQERLLALIRQIEEIGAYFILSNAEHYSIRDLYNGVGTIHTTQRYSRVGGRNKTRGMFNEVIITNINQCDE